jgi:hypothetical protein
MCACEEAERKTPLIRRLSPWPARNTGMSSRVNFKSPPGPAANADAAATVEGATLPEPVLPDFTEAAERPEADLREARAAASVTDDGNPATNEPQSRIGCCGFASLTAGVDTLGVAAADAAPALAPGRLFCWPGSLSLAMRSITSAGKVPPGLEPEAAVPAREEKPRVHATTQLAR